MVGLSIWHRPGNHIVATATVLVKPLANIEVPDTAIPILMSARAAVYIVLIAAVAPPCIKALVGQVINSFVIMLNS